MGELKVREEKRSLAGSPALIRVMALLAVIGFLGLLVGAMSSRLPVLILFGVLGGVALLVIVWFYPFFGVVLAFISNLIIPQAGPNWNLGIQVAIVGETRGLHFNVHEIIMAMVLLAVLIKILISVWKKDWDDVRDLVRSPISIGVALYVLTSILACFIGLINDAEGLLVLFRFVRTTFFFYIFFMMIYIVRNRRQFQVLIVAMLVCFTLIAAFGLVQKALGETWSNQFNEKVLKRLGYPADINYVAGESSAQAYRINSTFAHPNILGGYLVFALPFFVSFLSLTWRLQRYRLWLLLLVALGINLAALFLTGSRAAWVAAGVIAFLYGIFGFFDRRMWLVLVTVLLVFALIFVMLNPPEFVKKRFSGLSAKEAADSRMYQYKLALDYFLEHPLFGIGMGMEGQRIIENNLRYTWAAVENVWLTYMVSHGVVGLSALLLVFILYWMVLFKARSGSKNDPFIYFNAEAFILGMVGFAVSNMFGAWLLFAIPMVTLMWFYMGMAGSLYNIYQAEQEVTQPELPSPEPFVSALPFPNAAYQEPRGTP
ncbi:MAG: O-antigen ligase family protein [Actinomycetota bacterium]